MKKIILAVASVLALGLLASCKQQIEGSLNVTATNYNKSLDAGTSKTFFYKASGAVSQTTDTTSQYKAVGADSAVYTSQVTKTVQTWTPTTDVKVVISENPLTNVTTYEYSWKAELEIVYTATAYANNSSTVANTTKYVYNKNRTLSGTNFTNIDQYVKIYKIGGKFYTDAKAADGSEIVSADFNPDADTVDLSKFSDTTTYSNTVVTGVADTTANYYTNVPTSDWTQKTTTVTGGKVSTISLAKK